MLTPPRIKFATLVFATSLLGTALLPVSSVFAAEPNASAQPSTPTQSPEPRAFITIAAKDQPPVTVSLSGKLSDGKFEFLSTCVKVDQEHNLITLTNNVVISVKKQDKVLWSISVPEGEVTVFTPKTSPK